MFEVLFTKYLVYEKHCIEFNKSKRNCSLHLLWCNLSQVLVLSPTAVGDISHIWACDQGVTGTGDYFEMTKYMYVSSSTDESYGGRYCSYFPACISNIIKFGWKIIMHIYIAWLLPTRTGLLGWVSLYKLSLSLTSGSWEMEVSRG